MKRSILMLTVLAALMVAVGAPSAASAQPVFDNVNHYKCYPIVDLIGVFDPLGAFLVDQFGPSDTQIRRPVELCNPVDKNGEGVPNPEAHLVCYEIIEALHPRREVATWNQFGDLQFIVQDPKKICVPSSKQLIF